MLKIIKRSVIDLFVMLILMSGAFMSAQDANAARREHAPETMKSVGNTADGKYRLYAIQHNEEEDVNYFVGNNVYRAGDLMGLIPFISKADHKSGIYKCHFVCRDPISKHVVGINPEFETMYKTYKQK